jgi:hypothetical protein
VGRAGIFPQQLINETSKPNPLAEALVAADSMAAKIELPFDISIRARKGD